MPGAATISLPYVSLANGPAETGVSMTPLSLPSYGWISGTEGIWLVNDIFGTPIMTRFGCPGGKASSVLDGASAWLLVELVEWNRASGDDAKYFDAFFRTLALILCRQAGRRGKVVRYGRSESDGVRRNKVLGAVVELRDTNDK